MPAVNRVQAERGPAIGRPGFAVVPLPKAGEASIARGPGLGVVGGGHRGILAGSPGLPPESLRELRHRQSHIRPLRVASLRRLPVQRGFLATGPGYELRPAHGPLPELRVHEDRHAHRNELWQLEMREVVGQHGHSPHLRQCRLWSLVAQILLPAHETQRLAFGADEGLRVMRREVDQHVVCQAIDGGGDQHLARVRGAPHVLDDERDRSAVGNRPAEGPLELPREEGGEAHDGDVRVERGVRKVPKRFAEGGLGLLRDQEEWRLVEDCHHGLPHGIPQEVFEQRAPIERVAAENQIDIFGQEVMVLSPEGSFRFGPRLQLVVPIGLRPLALAVVVQLRDAQQVVQKRIPATERYSPIRLI
mmetsp:Transcript_149105/g.478919  ORF Transcript_149105/g.478919 Transcript_149105/m.478919 type:complete len:361 (+) Transcript_149105:338-1420(+)